MKPHFATLTLVLILALASLALISIYSHVEEGDGEPQSKTITLFLSVVLLVVASLAHAFFVAIDLDSLKNNQEQREVKHEAEHKALTQRIKVLEDKIKVHVKKPKKKRKTKAA